MAEKYCQQDKLKLEYKWTLLRDPKLRDIHRNNLNWFPLEMVSANLDYIKKS